MPRIVQNGIEFSNCPPKADALDELSDVTITSPENGQVIKYNGTKWVNSTESGGGISATEMTAVQYNNLPQADKLDPDVLHFITDSTTTALDVSTYVTKNENSMSITADTVNDTLIFAWNGGTNIGASAVYGTAISATVDKIRFKITTGTSYSTSNDRFKVGIGIKTAYTPSTFVAPNDADWLAVKIFATNNSVFEDELDLTSISANSYLYVCGHGWNMTVDNVVCETTTAQPKLFYKDNDYTGDSGASTLDDLTDVSLSSPSSGQILKYDGTDWVNANESTGVTELEDLTDVNITSATDGQILKYDGATSKWVNGTGGGGASALDDLTDVDITSPTGGQSLVYNATSGNWENSTGSMPWIDVIGTLEAGQTSITLTDIHINTNSVVEIFTDSDVDYNSVTVASSSVTVTFDAQASNIGVMARITAVNASSIVYDIDLSHYVTNKIWYRSDYQSSSSDTSGINVQGSDSRNDWTSGVTVCIDLDEFTIPASFTKMIIYVSTWSATGHSGIFAVSNNTKYEATTSNTSDAIISATRLGYPYIDSNYGSVSETDVVYEISCVPSNFGRYLYIYVGDGLAAEQASGYNNTYNGTFNATFAGIRFV